MQKKQLISISFVLLLIFLIYPTNTYAQTDVTDSAIISNEKKASPASAKKSFVNKKPAYCIYQPIRQRLWWGKVSGADGYQIYQKKVSSKQDNYKYYKTVKKGTSLNIKSKNYSAKYRARAYKIINKKKVYSKYSTNFIVLE